MQPSVSFGFSGNPYILLYLWQQYSQAATIFPDLSAHHQVKELPVLSKPDTLPPEYQGFSMATDIRNLAVPCEGAYSFSIYLNGDEIATKKVPIFKKVD